MKISYSFLAFCIVLLGHFSAYADVLGWDKEYALKKSTPSATILANNAAAAKALAKDLFNVRQSRASRGKRRPSCCKGPVEITQKDINEASAQAVSGYIIDEPGLYKLCEDVIWNNRFSDSYAITIASDNVSLDLGGHLILQLDRTTSRNFAIQVAPNTKFVEIQNGGLQLLSGGGIFVKEGATCITIDRIQVDKSCYRGGIDLGQFNAGTSNLTAGILFFGAQPPLEDIFIAPCLPSTFISPNPVSNVLVTNCTFCDLGILDGVSIEDCIIAGVGTSWANSITVQNVHVDRVFSQFQSSPLSFSFGNDLVISNAVLTNLTSFVCTAAVYIDIFKGAVVEDVIVSNLRTTISEQGPAYQLSRGAEGSKIGAAQNVTMRRCSFVDIAIVKESEPEVPNIARASGVSLDGCSFIQISDCSAKDISNSDGWAYGFGSNPDGFFPLVLPSPPFACTRIAYPDTLFANIFSNCFVENVRVSGLVNTRYAAGLNLNYANGQAVNCTVHEIHDQREGSSQAYGIILTKNQGVPQKPESTAINCIVANNRISNCDTLGIFDDTFVAADPSTRTNTINSNYAYKNGAGGNVNYSMSPFMPVRIWAQTVSLPSPVDNNGVLDAALDNIDVRNS